MVVRTIVTFATVLLTSQSLLATNEPLRLASTSPWNVNYADDYCRLAGKFGEGEETVVVFFDRYGPEQGFRLTLSGAPMETGGQRDSVLVQFGPAEAEQPLPYMKGNLGRDAALVISGSARIAPPTAEEQDAIRKKKFDDAWIDLQPIDPARFAAVRYLKVGKPLSKPVVLETGSLRKAFATLDACVDELVASWGVDVEKHKNLKRAVTPKESPGRWVVSEDYPTKMLNAGQPAIVEFRMNVGPDGVPTQCHIQTTTRPKEFDDAVCGSLMRRAKFDPALDSDGNPISSYWRNRVTFLIPNY
jgi:Gram-negative bacterial TonB protein C-terminal